MEFIIKMFSQIRSFLIKIKLTVHGVKFGKWLKAKRVYIKNKGRIILGDHVYLESFPDGEFFRTGLQTHCKEAIIEIGSYCNLRGTMIHCLTSVKIGNYCMFGPGTRIVDNDSHRITTDIKERRMKPVGQPIIIEDNVWTGADCLILKGVTIGKNAIVAAKSVVSKDVPPDTLVGGIPARIIKTID
jgi:acetyltransferase-like isoleucine patch superfamily enzyme